MQTLCVMDVKSQVQPRSSATTSTSRNSNNTLDLLQLSPTAPAELPQPQPQGACKFYYDIISTGAPTAHALGFRRGGLLEHEVELGQLQREMWALDEQLTRTQRTGMSSRTTGI